MFLGARHSTEDIMVVGVHVCIVCVSVPHYSILIINFIHYLLPLMLFIYLMTAAAHGEIATGGQIRGVSESDQQTLSK